MRGRCNCPSSSGAWVCSLPQDHDGAHRAHMGHDLASPVLLAWGDSAPSPDRIDIASHRRTLRDQYAGQAMAALIAAGEPQREGTVRDAVWIAEALVAALYPEEP